MKVINKKEQLVLSVYREKIENNLFDEQDISSLLIYIRSLLDAADREKLCNISDLCDYVAHRDRDEGRAKDGILAAIMNDYRTKGKSNKIAGYQGIMPDKWRKEWNYLGALLNMNISDATLKEISICVISMLQSAVFYEDKHPDANSRPMAKMEILQGDDFIDICSTEGFSNSKYIVYFKVNKLCFHKKYNILVDDAVYAKRENGQLRLINEQGEYII